jgi:molybdenum-dependent DNA-binding transcriptional regulator ModE
VYDEDWQLAGDGLSKVRALEKEYGLPIRKIVVDALNEHGSVEIAAETLGYSGRHMRCLIQRLGIQKVWK